MLIKKNKIIILFLFLLLFCFSLISNSKTASAIEFTPQVTIPGSNFQAGVSTTIENSTATIGKYIKSFYNYLIAIVGLMAAIVLMLAGVIWLTAAGNTSKISQAKGLMMGSFTGIVLVLTSYIILKTINPYLVTFRDPGIKIVEPIETEKPCCYEETGLVEKNVFKFSDGRTEEKCPSKSVICKKDEKCLETDNISQTTGRKIWKCIGTEIIQNSKCCEYSDGLGNMLCETVKMSDFCPAKKGALSFNHLYKNVMCDPEGNSRNSILGGQCVYPGTPQLCCQCKTIKTLWWWNSVACKDNYSEGACHYWCSITRAGGGIASWLYTQSPGKCQSTGYCN